VIGMLSAETAVFLVFHTGWVETLVFAAVVIALIANRAF
jgi:hypothetical protein